MLPGSCWGAHEGFGTDLPRLRAGTRVPRAGPALRLAALPQGPRVLQLPCWGFGECSQEGLGLHGRGDFPTCRPQRNHWID